MRSAASWAGEAAVPRENPPRGGGARRCGTNKTGGSPRQAARGWHPGWPPQCQCLRPQGP